MNRGKFTIDKDTGKLVPYEPPRRYQAHEVMTDEMEPLESMVDGSMWTSKHRYREHLRANGMIEKGNDKGEYKRQHFTETDAYQRNLRRVAEEQWYAVRDGMAALSEYDRERCKQIDHNLENYNYDRRARDRDGNPLE